MVVRVRVPETFFKPLRLGLGGGFASLFLSNVVVTLEQKLQIAQCWRMDSIVYVETTQ